MATEPNKDSKLRELILYISDKSADDPRFGKVKLNKILFYADFLMHDRRGRSITGQEYMKLAQGPAPRRMLAVLNDMERGNEIRWLRKEYHGYRQIRPVGMREADLGLFSAEDISVVDEVIGALWEANATETAELSHRFIGWRLARERETIPYASVRLSDRELTPQEMEHGLAVERRLSADRR